MSTDTPFPAADRPRFALAVVATSDGFIARAKDHPPAAWASAEEQQIFLAEVEAADWAIMGRHTHEAADKPNRRRIIFTSAEPMPRWRRPTQVWLDPARMMPQALAPLVEGVRPLRDGLILGGTLVHDWFHRTNAIHRISLTVEPVTFGDGLPILSDQRLRDPVEALRQAGYDPVEERELNDAGTRLVTMLPRAR